jgi:hypothetical protein
MRLVFVFLRGCILEHFAKPLNFIQRVVMHRLYTDHSASFQQGCESVIRFVKQQYPLGLFERWRIVYPIPVIPTICPCFE